MLFDTCLVCSLDTLAVICSGGIQSYFKEIHLVQLSSNGMNNGMLFQGHYSFFATPEAGWGRGEFAIRTKKELQVIDLSYLEWPLNLESSTLY